MTNYALCFSTMRTIVDWVTEAPGVPQPELLREMERLRNYIDVKIELLRREVDPKRKVG